MALTGGLLKDSEKKKRIHWLIFFIVIVGLRWVDAINSSFEIDPMEKIAIACSCSLWFIILYFCAYKGYGSKMLGWSMFASFGGIARLINESHLGTNQIEGLFNISTSLMITIVYIFLSSRLMTINREIRQQASDPTQFTLKQRIRDHLNDASCLQILEERQEILLQKWPNLLGYISDIYTPKKEKLSQQNLIGQLHEN